MTAKCQLVIQAFEPLFLKHNALLNVQVRNNASRSRSALFDGAKDTAILMVKQAKKSRKDPRTGEDVWDMGALAAANTAARQTFGTASTASGDEKETDAHKGVTIIINNDAITNSKDLGIEVIGDVKDAEYRDID